MNFGYVQLFKELTLFLAESWSKDFSYSMFNI